MAQRKSPKPSLKRETRRERGSFLSLAEKLYQPTFLRRKNGEKDDLSENEYSRMLDRISE